MKKIKTVKDIQKLLLTDEQVSTLKDTILVTMKESFLESGVSSEEFDKLFGNTPATLAKHIVINTQMAIVRDAAYGNAIEKFSKKKTTKKVVKTIKKVKKTK